MLSACGPPARIDAPPPSSVADAALAADSAIALAPTYASAPVSLDLRLLLGEIEQTIPTHIGSLDNRLLVSTSPRTWVAIEVLRGPLDITFGHGSVTLATRVAYRGRVWRKVLLTTVSASCGTGEKAPLASIRIRTTYRLDTQWRIRTRSQVLTVERATADPADECHVTFLGLDVTDKVLDAARAAIAKELKVADARLASVDVRGAVAPAWAALQQPISARDSTIWLSLHPEAIGVGPVTVKDSVASAMLTLLARPQVLAGVRPAADSLPLPPLTKVPVGDTLIAMIGGELTYGAANDILRSELRGHKLRVRGRRLTVDDVAMSYIGRNRVALGVQLSGAVEGRIYFVGTPLYDPATDAISVPDLDYDVQTSNILVQGISWLSGDKLRDDLRRKARVPAGALLDAVRGAANREITRDVTDGVHLSGRIGSAHALAARATASGFRAQAMGGGKLALRVRVDSVFANTHIPREPIKGIAEDSTGD